MPTHTYALVLRKSEAQKKPVYQKLALPALGPGDVLVKLNAAAFNARDLWIRKGMYPGIALESVLGSDAAGTVIASGEDAHALQNARVMLVPMRGWERHPDAPDGEMRILGGSHATRPCGAFSEHVVVAQAQLVPTPAHLDDVHAAAWPLGGLTAWRAAVVNGRVTQGDNVLITGVGGGVALTALQLCVAKGAHVYVTSGSQDKIAKAVALGAKGGVVYKDDDWPKQLAKLLKAPLDLVIDAGGGPIMQQLGRTLKQGGRLVCYGMHAQPMIAFTMREVMQNQQLIGSTMGSKSDLIDATHFIAMHRIVPVVSAVIDGLENAEEGFAMLKSGDHFGKIAIRLGGKAKEAKL